MAESGKDRERTDVTRPPSLDHFQDLSLVAHTRVPRLLSLSSISRMATPRMASLYQELQRVFEARPTDLAKTGKLLTQLKVRAIESAAPRASHDSPGRLRF